MKVVKELKASDIKRMFPRRDSNSHKGMNGKVLVIGGSIDYFGAPILCAMGALNSGVDLVYMYVPECNFDVTRTFLPDLIVRKYDGNYLNMKAVRPILDFAKECDAVLIGPGLGTHMETTSALLEIVKGLEITTILDASAIHIFQKIKEVPLSQKILITPHHNEFETLTGKNIKIAGSLSHKILLLRTLATDLKINILLKGPIDLIASEEGVIISNITGVLSGFVSSLIAQGTPVFEASQIAAYINGKTGDELFKQKGYCMTASDIANELPYVIKSVAY
jgi:hydroxyethylthiazole kinase-like uncharacterized protein yjeF